MRSGTGAAPIRSQRWSVSRSGWRPCHDRDDDRRTRRPPPGRVEMLCSGVPSWDAVAVLGSAATAEDQFSALLDRVGEGGLPAGRAVWPAARRRLRRREEPPAHSSQPSGHGVGLCREHRGDQQGDAATRPGEDVQGRDHGRALDPVRLHGVLADSAASLDQDTPGYAELSRWVNSPASGLDERFSASLLCHERLRGGEVPGSDETIDALVRGSGVASRCGCSTCAGR